MIQKIKKYIFVAAASLTMLAPGLMATASATSITDNLCTGANSTTGITGSGGCSAGTTGTEGIKTVAAKIIDMFSIIVGIVAVVMIIFGGFKYITSGGDSNSVTGAKNTLIYAIIGLIVVALAQFIVKFVLTTASNTALVG